MSTEISRTLHDTSNTSGCIVGGMQNKSPRQPPLPTLKDYLLKVMNDEGFSQRDIEHHSRRGGDEGVSAGYINDILSGRTNNPTVKKAAALARGLKRPVLEVISIVLGTPLDPRAALSGEITALFESVGEAPEDLQSWFKDQIQMISREFQYKLKERKRK